MRDAFLKTITTLAEQDPNVILLTADLGFGVFEEFEQKFPGQYFNVGVAEQNMTGLATGLALEGKKLITYSIGNFPTLRCLEQIRNDACYHEANITIVASGGGFSYGALGMSHHATEDLSILRSLPGITVVAPGTAWEAAQATWQLVQENKVGYLRIDKTSADDKKGSLGGEFKLGRARRIIEGSDCTIICTGGILAEAVKAAELAKEKGVSCRVVSHHTVKPADVDEILDAAKNTGGIVTVEEHNVIGGIGSVVAEVCLDNGILPGKFKRLGLEDTYSSVVGSQKFLRSYYGMDAESILDAVCSS